MRPARVEIAEGIVTQSGQMNDSIESEKIVYCDIADVFTNRRNFRTFAVKPAVFKKVSVQANDFKSRGR
jgi:hypothetical protein